MLCLIYGVKLLSRGLEGANTKRLEKFLSLSAGKLILAFITGTVSTALLQSSTAVTVITVSLVDSGLMKLTQAVGIIYGANIGTTVAAQFMSLKLTGFGVPVAIAGSAVMLLSERNTVRNLGMAFAGLGFMLAGINILSTGAPYIKESEIACRLFGKYGKNPYMGLFIGTAATMLVQSSSATVGLAIVLFNAGLISFEAAVGLIMGDNIGTCATAQLASIGAGTAARRTAWAHTMYNILGAAAVMVFLGPFAELVRSITHLIGQDRSKLVANTHAIFNILSAAAFLPVTKYYVMFIEWMVPGRPGRRRSLAGCGSHGLR